MLYSYIARHFANKKIVKIEVALFKSTLSDVAGTEEDCGKETVPKDKLSVGFVLGVQ